MKIVYRGAEATLYQTYWLDQKALVKERVPKPYRHPTLDQAIRHQRTKQEAVLVHQAKKAGVRTPLLFKIDKTNDQLWMEWIPGKNLKQFLNPRTISWCTKAGKQTAQLHAAGIIHGDLTTSNWIVNKRELVLVDFGLGFFSNELEDQAVDVLNFKKTFIATHYRIPNGLQLFLAAYEKTYSRGSQVIKRIQQIEQRARYS